MKAPRRYVMTSDRARMRALRAERLSYAAIGAQVGFSASCVMEHTRDIPKPPIRDKVKERALRLTRTERFFARCNRAVAEARP